MTQATPAPRLPILVNLNTQERFLLDGPEVMIGRAESNQIVLPGDEFVSGSHAKVYWAEGNWWIEDLKSSNGTKVDEQIIGEPRKLSPGNVIKIGRTKFRID